MTIRNYIILTMNKNMNLNLVMREKCSLYFIKKNNENYDFAKIKIHS